MKWTKEEWKEKINDASPNCVPYLESLNVRYVSGSKFSVGVSELPEEQQEIIMARLTLEFMEE